MTIVTMRQWRYLSFARSTARYNDNGHATQQDLSIIHRPKSFFVNIYNFVLPGGVYQEFTLTIRYKQPFSDTMIISDI